MIQDIFPSRFYVEYPPKAPQPDDLVLLFTKRGIGMKNETAFFSVSDLLPYLPEEALLYLFRMGDASNNDAGNACTYSVFTCKSDADTDRVLSQVPAFRATLRHFRSLRPMASAFIGYTAHHLWSWYGGNRYCGACGSETRIAADERKVVCTHCGREVYPRINPSVIVAVTDGDRLLMTRYANRPVSWFVLVAGFIEIGESAEDTVRREVMEETGIRVKNIRYVGSQPWGIPGNLTLGYTCELDGSDQVQVDHEELAEAKWFNRSEVPVPDDDVSITSAMIHAFAQGRL